MGIHTARYPAGHCFWSICSLPLRGCCIIDSWSLSLPLSPCQLNSAALDADLDNSWEVLAEPIQTVMRRYGVSEPYEKLKVFTRGQRVTQQSMQAFVEGIDGLPQEAKEALKRLTPANYIGNAAQQAKDLEKYLRS